MRRTAMRLRYSAVAFGLAASTVVTVHAAPHASAAVAITHICDPIDATACLLPFPNNWFTRADPSTPTGRRVNISILATPRSVGLVPISPADQNRADGFSPGSALLAHVPGLDLARTGAAPVTDIARSLDPAAPIVVVDAGTGERWPYWAELDANATNAGRQALIVRPARNFREGHRYLVLLRDLRRADGSTIAPSPKVADLLDGVPLFRLDRQRSDALRATVRDLNRLGVNTANLVLAWDFTVASTASLTGRALHMRDDAFGKLGAAAPRFTVTSVTDNTAEQNPNIARVVRGEVEVPSYLNLPGGPPGSALRLGADGLPEQAPGNIQRAVFQCNVPRAALDSPARPVLFGHGLLGAETEIDSDALERAGQQGDMMFCATRWIGMATEDILNVVTVFADFSRFNTIPDRLQQSYLNFLFLGRAMVHADGFAAHPAFVSGGRTLVDTAAGLAYVGASQGGIEGAALSGLAQDFTRSVLIVPGTNYSTLLNRSVDFDQFRPILDVTYADRLDQQLALSLIQMLWDRGEGNGYAAHLTSDPLPDTPVKRVLLHEAFGDHQVANVATEVMARTMRVAVHQPALRPGRSPDLTPFWDIPPVPGSPFAGSALVMWDSGAAPPPLANTPPRTGDDPHGSTRNSPEAFAQIAQFLETGLVVDTCGGGPCTIPLS